jgi:hypothetical protein
MGRGPATNTRVTCEEVNPVLGDHSVCVCTTVHKHHRDVVGRTWPNTGPSEFEEIRANKEDQLRQLLSYCKTQDGRYMTAQQAYIDVASKLKAILDGES